MISLTYFAQSRRWLDRRFGGIILLVLVGIFTRTECVETVCYDDRCVCVGLVGTYGIEANCSGRNLDRIPSVTADVRYVTSLDFSNNDIAVLKNGDLGQFLHLRKVVITGNHLDNVSPGVFNSTDTQSSIQYVDFSGNHLHQLSQCFQHLDEYSTRLDNLTTLILSNNEIGPTVEEYAFNGLRMLETLDLSVNNIKAIEARTLKYLRNIKHVDLSYNAIETISSGLFGRSSMPETFDLTGNMITMIPSGMPSSLKVLKLGANRISVVTSKYGKSLRDLPNLTSLNLSFNGLRGLMHLTFANMSKLKYLDLSNNKLQLLYSDIFAGASSLEYLFLNRNPGLKDLPNDLFASLHNLRFLFLYRCALTTLEIGTPSISPFSPSFTSAITSENVDVDLSFAPNLKALWLFGNPMNCDCQILPLVWLINVRNLTLDANLDVFLGNPNADSLVVEYLRKDGSYEGNSPISGTYCATPSNRHNEVVGLPIMGVPESDLICPHQPFYIAISMFMGIALFAAAVPVVFIVVFIYLCTVWILTKKCGLSLSEDED